MFTLTLMMGRNPAKSKIIKLWGKLRKTAASVSPLLSSCWCLLVLVESESKGVAGSMHDDGADAGVGDKRVQMLRLPPFAPFFYTLVPHLVDTLYNFYIF